MPNSDTSFARSFLFIQLERAGTRADTKAGAKHAWPVDVGVRIAQWRESLSPTLSALAGAGAQHDDLGEAIHSWARSFAMDYDWFLVRALMEGWGGAVGAGYLSVRQERQLQDWILAGMPNEVPSPPPPRIPAFDIHFAETDMTHWTLAQVRAHMFAKCEHTYARIAESISAQAKAGGWVTAPELRTGRTSTPKRSVTTRYRWWVQRHCLEMRYSEIAGVSKPPRIEDDVKNGVRLAYRELGLSRRPRNADDPDER